MTVGRVIRATLFPYTTLFRSEVGGVEGLPAAAGGGGDGVHGGGPASGGDGGGGRGRSGRDRSRGGDVAGQVQAPFDGLGQLLVVDRQLEEVDRPGAHDVPQRRVGPAAEG